MSAQRLFKAIGRVDDGLLQEAEAYRGRPRGRHWGRWGALAACAVLVVGGMWLVRGGFLGGANTGAAPGEGTGTAGGNFEGGCASPTLNYSGPVLPLTAEGDLEGLTAEREITYTLDAAEDSAAVADRYALTNATDRDKTLTLYYPYAATLVDPALALTLDGGELDTGLLLGAYAGTFRGADNPDLSLPSFWEDYKTLLESGDYLSTAKAAELGPDSPVTVYTFHDVEAPEEAYDTAALALEFTMPKGSHALTWRLNGTDCDEETRQCRYSFVVGLGAGEQMVIVLGTPPDAYRVVGYENIFAEKEAPEVTARVEVTQSTFHSALFDCLSLWEKAVPATAHLAVESRLRAVIEGLSYADSGEGSWTNLENVVSMSLGMRRVLYRTAEITVPAGESIEVTASFHKEVSQGFVVDRAENRGMEGYDLASTLGSALTFTSQRVRLDIPADWEIVRQNLGFDVQSGAVEVELDLNQEHYYLEVRAPRQ